jgi:hypothetical protein
MIVRHICIHSCTKINLIFLLRSNIETIITISVRKNMVELLSVRITLEVIMKNSLNVPTLEGLISGFRVRPKFEQQLFKV